MSAGRRVNEKLAKLEQRIEVLEKLVANDYQTEYQYDAPDNAKVVDQQPAPPNADGPTKERPWWLQSTVTNEYFCFTSNDNYQKYKMNGQPLDHGVGNIKYFTVSTRLPDETPLPVLAYADMMRRTYVNGKDGEKWRWYYSDKSSGLRKYSDRGYVFSGGSWELTGIEENHTNNKPITPEESAAIEARLRGFENVEAMLREDEKKESVHPYLCVKHGGSPWCEDKNKVNGLNCPKCEKFTNKVFASTGVERCKDNANVMVGVTAHCQCGNVFCDDVKAGFHTREAELQAKLATAEKERDEAQRKLEAAMNEKYATEAQSEVERLRKQREELEKNKCDLCAIDRMNGRTTRRELWAKIMELEKRLAEATTPKSKVPCCKCGGDVVEFIVPTELWNRVMRPDGKETDQEYICFDCWNKTLLDFTAQKSFAKVWKIAEKWFAENDNWCTRFLQFLETSNLLATDETVRRMRELEKQDKLLIEFFQSEECDNLGRNGDHDNLSRAETSIRAMKELIIARKRTKELEAEVEWMKQSNLITPTKIIMSNEYVDEIRRTERSEGCGSE